MFWVGGTLNHTHTLGFGRFGLWYASLVCFFFHVAGIFMLKSETNKLD